MHYISVNTLSTKKATLNFCLLNFLLYFHSSLGEILGLASLVILVLYILGITWKLVKIHRGTYVEEEPVFLKYK